MAQDWFASNAPKKASGQDWFAANAAKPKEAPAPPSPPAEHPHARTARLVGKFGKGALNAVKAIPGAVYDVARDVAPYDENANPKFPLERTVRGIGQASIDVAGQALDAFRRGDYFRAAVKGVESFPVIGPMMSAAGDKMEQGDVAEAIGELATNALMTFAPMAPKGAPKAKPALLKGPTNAKDAAAVAFAKERGVPLDAGTATGSNFIKTVQEKAANSFGGARTAEALKDTQASNLTRVSGDLLDTAAPNPTNPVAAGEGVRNALKKQIQDLHIKADADYDVIRQIEKSESDRIAQIPTKTQATMDVTQRTPLAVDITEGVKQMLPLYQQLKRESELGIPMHGAKGRTLAALDGLMNAPNVAPLSVVDAALGDLKALARGADMPELRTQGQASAAFAVQKLDAQVRATAAKAGPNVLKALEDGRAATKQKYTVAETLDMLSAEPGQVYRQLTQNKDVGLERLKSVQRLAPTEMPNVARAFLEDMFQQATAEGGFAHADRLWANWQKLGPQTKKTLFPKAGQIEALDNFFLLSKRIGEVKNPSGTAKVAGALDLVTGIPAWAVSKLLLTPGGVKALTSARVAAKAPSKAARALAASNLTKAAQSAGVPLEAIPAFGADTPTASPAQSGRPQ